MSQQFLQVGEMLPDDLVRAIALPALQVGLPVDPELVSQVVSDMRDEPGALPLMQFALGAFQAGGSAARLQARADEYVRTRAFWQGVPTARTRSVSRAACPRGEMHPFALKDLFEAKQKAGGVIALTHGITWSTAA